MKAWIYRGITGALLLLWMMIIFGFSAQTAEQSDEVSGSVSVHMIETANEMFELGMTQEQIAWYAQEIEHLVRKLAHMTEYAILGILSASCALGYWSWGKRIAIGSFLFAVCYAVTDEVHQLYVAGRTGRVWDVCIDSAGVFLGLFFFGLGLKLAERIAKKSGFK